MDLTAKTTEVRELDEKIARNFVGGPALGAKILYDEMRAYGRLREGKRHWVRLRSGKRNRPLDGRRYTVVSKSPVTGGWNDANSGGNFGPLLRKSGFDGVFVRGISEKPVYIFIDDAKSKSATPLICGARRLLRPRKRSRRNSTTRRSASPSSDLPEKDCPTWRPS